MNRLLAQPLARPLLVFSVVAPLLWLLHGAATDRLGANPAEALIRTSGEWTLRLLCLTLAVTPLREATGWSALARFRRTLGVATFGWALLHLLAYAWLDMGLVAADILRDIGKRPFILVGTLTLLLMLPLAATSWDRAVRALGARRWRRLHRTVYLLAPLALLHFYWMRAAKGDLAEVGVYTAIVALLLGWRLARWLRRPGQPTAGHGRG
jgi:sulfoxide reductase heme-binding subunit YedZ